MERLLNLIMTIGSRRRIDRQRLFSVIPEYANAKDAEAREKMFERDKALIRELGIPLVTETDAWDDNIVYYRIEADDAAEDLDLTSAEYTLLLAASRAWDDAAAGGAARRVRAKLQTYDLRPDDDLLKSTGRGSVESLPVLSPLIDAVTHEQAVTFRYRRADGTLNERTVEPWSVGVVDGHWYLVGFDRDRGAERIFRASRIESFPRVSTSANAPRPTSVNLRAALHGINPDTEEAAARLRVAPWKALPLRDELEAPLDAPILELPARRRTDVLRTVRAEARWMELLEPAAWREEALQTFTEIENLHRGPTHLEAVEDAPALPTPKIRVTPSGTDHVTRLIALASFVQQRGEASMDDLSTRFGVTERHIADDLSVLYMCGDLGTGWEDLIDAQWDGGFVRVYNADALRRRFRLTRPEAIALLAGLGALGPLTGEAGEHARSVKDKLTALVGGATHNTADDSTSGHKTRLEKNADALRHAIQQEQSVQLVYSPPTRPGAETRRIQPRALETATGRTYLRAHLLDEDDMPTAAERLFRLDRIVSVDQAEYRPAARAAGQEPAPHDAREAEPVGLSPDVREDVPPGIQGREDQPVWLRLEGPARWIAEAFEAEEIRDGAEAGVYARLDHPVRSALLDAVLESGGAAEVLTPASLRTMVAVTAGAARSVHAGEHG